MTMYPALGVLLVGLVNAAEVLGRIDTGKAFRSLPAISNSLVNLGKMDISFHFNSKPADPQRYEHSLSGIPFYSSKSDHEIEPCPCSSIKNYKNPFQSMSGPADILNKILKSNDLFSYNQEPTLSAMCCDSHEVAHDESFFFELNPRAQPQAEFYNVQPATQTPFLLENLLSKSFLYPPIKSQPKAIEIFIPKKRDGLSSVFDFPKVSSIPKKSVKKSEVHIIDNRESKNDYKNSKHERKENVKKNDVDIQILGDREMKNDVSYKIEPYVPPKPKAGLKNNDVSIQTDGDKEMKNDFNYFEQSTVPARHKKNEVEIQIVGDKELRNDFKNYRFEPTGFLVEPKTEVETNKNEKRKNNENNVQGEVVSETPKQ